MLIRVTIFCFSYIAVIMSISNCILFLNYRTLGYNWRAVMLFFLQTAEFYIAIVGLVILFIVVYDLIPSRSPFS